VEYQWLNKSVRIDSKLDGFRGTLYPFQHQGVAFLASVKRGLLLDKTGLGKTVQCIAAYDLLKTQKYPKLKIVVVTLASTQIQWENEFQKFLPTAKVKAVIGHKSARRQIYSQFYTDELDGYIVNYSQLLHDMKLTNPKSYFNLNGIGEIPNSIRGQQYLLVLDEIQKCKNVSAKTSKSALWLAERSLGVKGLTATPIYNHLVDIYGIFKLLDPNVFINKENFKKQFCVLSYVWSIHGQIVGYKNHDKLRQRIQHFVMGRTKKEVIKELPDLITQDYWIELPDWHMRDYEFIVGGGHWKKDIEENIDPIGAIQRAQVCVNAIETLDDYDGKESHPKLEEALRLVQENLVGENILIFSKFEKTISVLQKIFKSANIPFWRITGKESAPQRAKALKQFEELENTDQTAVMGITTAGGAGLNLQSAGTLIMLDRPWSGGEIEQIRGRIHRIGTKYRSLLEINIIAKDTIDEYVLESLRKKAKHSSKVFGSGDAPITIPEILEKIKRKNS